MSFDRPILIYSELCQHSNNFIKILSKHPELLNTFIRMNIDVNPQTKQRTPLFSKLQQEINQKISKVPTIIVSEQTENGPEIFILSDTEAFKWLDFKTKSKNEKELLGFNQNEMGSFSDGYANFGSTDLNEATEQNYKFFETDSKGKNVLIGETFQIDNNVKGPEAFLVKDVDNNQNTSDRYNNLESDREQFNRNMKNTSPNVQNFNTPNNNSKQNTNSTEFNNKLNNYKQDSESFKKPPPQQIDFLNPSFGLSGKISNKNPNGNKQQEMDDKLKQLMLDREL